MSEDDAKEWRWVGEDGVEKKTSEQELIAELSSEALPHYVLVWKRGWAEWLPAMQIAELSWTLPPGKADEAVKPKEKPGAESPPAPPLYRYPVIKRRAAGLKGDKTAPPRPSAPRPLRPPRPAGTDSTEDAGLEGPTLIAPSNASDALEPPTQVKAPIAPPVEPPAPGASDKTMEIEPEPVEAEEELDSTDEVEEVEAVLDESRPDNATPPDLGGFAVAGPEAGRQVYTDEVDDAETRVMPSKPPPPDASPSHDAQYVAPHAPPRPSAAPPAGTEGAELPNIPPPPPQPKGFEQFAQTAEQRLFSRPAYLAGVAAAGLVVLALIVLAVSSDEDEPAEAVAPATSATPTAARSEEPAAASTEKPPQKREGTRPCKFNRAPTRLEESAYVGVQAAFTRVPGSSRIAVGFATGRTEARGITIDAESLDHDQIFRQTGRAPVESVVPVAKAGKLGFEITRNEAGALKSGVAVDDDPPFVIGLDDDGRLALERSGSNEQSILWTLDEGKITTPGVARASDGGYAVTFREGGTSGKIRVGWLSDAAGAQGPLREVPVGEAFVGTPSIGAGKTGAVVAFAARGSSDDAWRVKLSSASRGAVPASAKTFVLPEGGPGDNAISPRVASLSGDRWLLQWTEGRSGDREVRVQVLDRTLGPLSAPTRVSPEGENAGQGALWVDGSTVVSLFFVQGKKSHELWGASLSCPGS